MLPLHRHGCRSGFSGDVPMRQTRHTSSSSYVTSVHVLLAGRAASDSTLIESSHLAQAKKAEKKNKKKNE